MRADANLLATDETVGTERVEAVKRRPTHEVLFSELGTMGVKRVQPRPTHCIRSCRAPSPTGLPINRCGFGFCWAKKEAVSAGF